MTYLVHGATGLESTLSRISSSVDTWIVLRDIESDGERDRGIFVLKARGTRHSNQIREFRLSDHDVEILEPYVGLEGVVTGSARAALEARERASAVEGERLAARRGAEIQRIKGALDRAVAGLTSDYEARVEEIRSELRGDAAAEGERGRMRDAMATRRGGRDGGARHPTKVRG